MNSLRLICDSIGDTKSLSKAPCDWGGSVVAKLLIRGGTPLKGMVNISGAKTARCPL